MKYLFVVAHPDDEILGAGATIHKLLDKGHLVYVCIMNSADETRYKNNQKQLGKDLIECASFMEYTGMYVGKFPNLRFNTVEHVELVKFIEFAIMDCAPDVIVTHHPDDPNNDHVHTSMACQEACRYCQRGLSNVKPVSSLMFMEVKSATDWAFNCKFNPNTFSEVSKEGLDKKIEALKLYENVVREHPHPRSERAINALAEYRGSQSGYEYAEAFEMVFKRGI